VRDPLLPLLACPTCRAALALDAGARDPDGHIMTGRLSCACGAVYPIRGGVPRLVPGSVASAAVETADRFAGQWKTFDHMAEYQEAALRAWLEPTGPEHVAGKVVFEGGCGKGRHTVVAAGGGAAAVVALDLGDAVEVAFAHTRALPNAHVIQGDLLTPPVARAFDLAFSVGVLHHLPDPRAGFDAVRGVVRPGGRVAVWVYGRENNEWIVRWVNPMREHLTARLPHRLLYALSLAPTALLAGLFPLYRVAPERLPYADYIGGFLAKLPLREVHNIVYDQLVTPIAYYLSEDEVRSWIDERLTDVVIGWHRKMSWRMSARVVG
jgi:SAM-dependent methyltransferase